MFDLRVINGQIIDGSGREAFSGDIGITNGKIAAIGDLSDSVSAQTIDAGGKVVCPGFVDVHTHSDISFFADPRQASQIRQGVTTQIVGLCGISTAPLDAKTKNYVQKMAPVPFEISWSSFASYLEEIDKVHPGTNIGSFVGHGVLRFAGMEQPVGSPSYAELHKMGQILDKALQEGAFGLSSGLEYSPGKAADVSELAFLCDIVSRHGGLHACHTRNRDMFYCWSLSEVLDITRVTGVRLQVSHINPKFGRLDSTTSDLLEMIDRMREQGFEVSADVMPTKWNHTNAIALLPLWMNKLAEEEFIKTLSSPDAPEKIRQNPSPVWQLAHQEKWDRIFVFASNNNTEYLGQSIQEIAHAWQCSGWEAICRMIVKEAPRFGTLTLTSDAFDIQDSILALKKPYSSLASDVMGLATDGVLAEEHFSPNTYNWIPEALKIYSFAENAPFSLEKVIQKLTSIPARQVGIQDRGLLYQDYYADIVIFDPNSVSSTVTLQKPSSYPSGFQAVLVNGKVAWQEDDEQIERHGMALRRS